MFLLREILSLDFFAVFANIIYLMDFCKNRQPSLEIYTLSFLDLGKCSANLSLETSNIIYLLLQKLYQTKKFCKKRREKIIPNPIYPSFRAYRKKREAAFLSG